MSPWFLCGSGMRPIHLSFDVDAMDPEYAPSTGTPGEFHVNDSHPPLSPSLLLSLHSLSWCFVRVCSSLSAFQFVCSVFWGGVCVFLICVVCL